MNNKISVIVPTYNSQNWLRRCLDSILCQTYNNLEIIVVDNGSSDCTCELVREYIEHDSRIQLFIEPRRGVSSARNLGIEKSTGDYICFVDGDDYIRNTYCEVLLSHIGNHDIAVCGVAVESTKKNTSFNCVKVTQEVDAAEFVNFISKMEYSSHTVYNKLYRSAFLKNSPVRFLEGKIYEDISFSFHAAMITSSSIFINQSLYVYCIRANSLSTTVTDVNMYDYVYQFKYVWQLLKQSSSLPKVLLDFKYALLYALYQLNRMYVRNSEVSEAAFRETSLELQDIIYEVRYYKV